MPASRASVSAYRPAPPLVRALALVRLVWLYAIACALIAAGLLQVRDWQLRDPGDLAPAAVRPLDPSLPLLGLNLPPHQPLAEMHPADLAAIRTAGFGWVRLRLDWNRIEPQPGRFAWAETDALLTEVIAADLVPLVVLNGSPAWARAETDANNPLAPPADPADFARFAAVAAARYGSVVNHYQIWDEPNVAPHWGARLIEPVAYAHLLSSAAESVRAADTGAVIALAALAPTADRGHTAIDEITFLRRLYAAGAADAFDVVALKPYGFGHAAADDRVQPQRLTFQRMRLVRRAMVAAGDAHTPIWAVAFGWNRATNRRWRTVSAADQARFATDALRLARGWPWLTAMAWPHAAAADAAQDGFALSPALLSALDRGRRAPPLAPQAPAFPWPWLLGTAAAGAVVAWRSRAALRRLNGWRVWAAPRSGASWLLGWGVLLLVYHLATLAWLIALCWIAAALLIRRRPLHGLLLAALLLPLHAAHKEIDLIATTWRLAPSHVALLCTLPALLPLAARRARRPRFRGWLTGGDWLALGWLLLGGLGAINVWHWPAYGEGLADRVLFPLLAYAGVRLLNDGRRSQQQVLVALALGGAVAAAVGLWDWFGGGGVRVDGVRRLMGASFSPNQTALYLLRSLFLWFGLVAAGVGRRTPLSSPLRRARLTLAWLSAGLVLLALLLTGSRGALLLGLPCGALLLGLLLPRTGIARPPTRRWTGGLLLAVAIVALVVLSSLGERLANSATVLRRFAIWRGALDLWLAYPWFGVGPGGFAWRYPAFLIDAARSEPNLLHPHNLWLEQATESGLPGVLWLGGLLLWLARRARRPLGPAQAGLLAGLGAGLAHGSVDAFLALPELAGWFWFAIGLLTTGPPDNPGESLEASQ